MIFVKNITKTAVSKMIIFLQMFTNKKMALYSSKHKECVCWIAYSVDFCAPNLSIILTYLGGQACQTSNRRHSLAILAYNSHLVYCKKHYSMKSQL